MHLPFSETTALYHVSYHCPQEKHPASISTAVPATSLQTEADDCCKISAAVMHAASGDFSIITYSALLLEYLLKNTNNLHKNIKMSVQIVITTLLFAMYYQNPFNLGKKSIESVKKNTTQLVV